MGIVFHTNVGLLHSCANLTISPVTIQFNPKKIATKGFSIDSVRFSCTLQHTKSLPKSEPQDGVQNGHRNLRVAIGNCQLKIDDMLVSIPMFSGAKEHIEVIKNDIGPLG